MCGKSARTVRSGGGQKRAHGDDYTGTKPETVETDKSEPTGYRAGPRPSQALVRQLLAHRTYWPCVWPDASIAPFPEDTAGLPYRSKAWAFR